MNIFSTIYRFFRPLVIFLFVAIVAGAVGVFVFLSLIPRLSDWPWLSHFPLLRPLTQSVTVIEKTEQVVIAQDEGIERFTAQPGTAVVSILSLPTVRNGISAVGIATRKTGVLLTNDGLVATYEVAMPVVENRRLTVFFSDGNFSSARFLAYDSTLNVAYYQTDRVNTPSIAFANSNDVRIGRRFVALSSTLDEGRMRLSTGVVAGQDRTFNLAGKTVASTDEWEGVFLSDVKFDSMFLGAPAVALNGEMIGFIGSIRIDNEDHFFLIPANALRQSLQRLIAHGPEKMPETFGAYYLSLTKETALTLGVNRDRGALIYTPSERTGLAVIAGSKAEQSGLRYGDIVIAVNGREINLDWPLSVALSEILPNETGTLLVIRGGQEIKLPFIR